LQEKPGDALARFNYARTAALSGKNLERGEQELKSLIADPPKVWPAASAAAAHFRLGSIYEQLGKKELARAEYEEAVKRNPRNEDAKKALASLR
jgi:tetratricopeptide (TPR) repeat protein